MAEVQKKNSPKDVKNSSELTPGDDDSSYEVEDCMSSKYCLCTMCKIQYMDWHTTFLDRFYAIPTIDISEAQPTREIVDVPRQKSVADPIPSTSKAATESVHSTPKPLTESGPPTPKQSFNYDYDVDIWRDQMSDAEIMNITSDLEATTMHIDLTQAHIPPKPMVIPAVAVMPKTSRLSLKRPRQSILTDCIPPTKVKMNPPRPILRPRTTKPRVRKARGANPP